MNTYKIDVMPGPLYFHIRIEQVNPGDGNNPVWRFEAPRDQFAPVNAAADLHQVSAYLEGAFWARLRSGQRI